MPTTAMSKRKKRKGKERNNSFHETCLTNRRRIRPRADRPMEMALNEVVTTDINPRPPQISKYEYIVFPTRL
jgi:hypothetical protein